MGDSSMNSGHKMRVNLSLEMFYLTTSGILKDLSKCRRT
jgi:hypothetical protein